MSYYCRMLFTNIFSCYYNKDGITPYLPIPIGRRLQPPSLLATTERILQRPIYQFQLEGGYNPLVYQLQLKGCYDIVFTNFNWKDATTPWFINYNWKDAMTPYLPIPIGRRLWTPGLSATTKRRQQPPADLFPTLAPPYHPNMFLTISLTLNYVTPTGL